MANINLSLSLSFNKRFSECIRHTGHGPIRLYTSRYWNRQLSACALLYAWESNIYHGSPSSFIGANDDFEFFFEGVHGMAKKSVGKDSSGFGSWKGFANINLREADKVALDKIAPSPDEILDCIGSVIESGHKITVTRGEGKKACVVSFTGQTDACPNKGYTLSSFAGDFYRAFMVNFYKHHYMANGSWSQFATDDEEYG